MTNKEALTETADIIVNACRHLRQITSARMQQSDKFTNEDFTALETVILACQSFNEVVAVALIVEGQK